MAKAKKQEKQEMHDWLVTGPITGTATVAVRAESAEAAKTAAKTDLNQEPTLNEWSTDFGDATVRVERND